MDRPAAPTLDPDTPYLHDAAAQQVCAMLEDAGYQALFVGGCVRNAIMGKPIADLDVSTDACPEAVMGLAEAAGLRAIPTGIDHGTVTIVAHHTPIEITTFRKDVSTDGRRAVVAFATDIYDDAKRRDFTMNALYADIRGRISDPLGGFSDVQARRVRFIDNAGMRIKEDFLRILRFFRFGAWYGEPQTGWDADALAAIAQNLDGLETLSAERVTAEVLKTLTAPDPTEAFGVMSQIGILARALPGADPILLGPVVEIASKLDVPADPILRLAALGDVSDAPLLRLSRRDREALDCMAEHATGNLQPRALGHVCGPRVGAGALILRTAILQAPGDPAALTALRKGAETQFPLRAADFPDLEGPALGAHLRALKERWLASDLTLSKSDLMGA